MRLVGINLTFKGGPEFRNQLASLDMRVSRGAEIATREGADLLKEAIRENMDGALPPKPGGSDPARRSGTLYEAVKMRILAGSIGAGRWNYEIYMDSNEAPYARRIELGFHGSDSLGRSYNQPAYPYFYKGVETAIGAGIIEGLFFEAWEEAVTI